MAQLDQEGACIGADGAKTAVTDRYLACVAQDQIDRCREHDTDGNGCQDVKIVIAQGKGIGQEASQDQCAQWRD
jgi:hypothetical protein